MNRLNEKPVNETNDEEHLAVLESARETLSQTQENIEIGKTRLENALKKYEARAKMDGRIKRI